MYKYIIKKDPTKGIYLLNEQGEEVAATDILEICGERRVFAFNGNMGAGKTTFIKQLCEAMGRKEEVYHFDCYRIKDIREAMDMGTEEYLYSGNYCFIEWAEMIEPLLPDDLVTVDIEVLENGDRELRIFN